MRRKSDQTISWYESALDKQKNRYPDAYRRYKAMKDRFNYDSWNSNFHIKPSSNDLTLNR